MVVEIESYDHYGRGVCHIDSKVCFVKGALAFETVEIEIEKEERRFFIAKVIKVIQKSPDRIEPQCPYYDACGGCHLGLMTYEAQLRFKEENMKEEMKRAFSKEISFLGIVGGSPFYYRNKVVLHSKDGQLGFYKEESHELVPVKECLLVDQRINQMISSLNKDEECMIRVSNCSCDFLLNDSFPAITSKIGSYQFQISPRSFFQVNSEVTEKLYDYLYSVVKEKKARHVLDLYCGIGTIGIYIHSLVEHVLGIEIVPEAIQNANFNKKLNQAENVSFLCGDVGCYIDQLKNQYDLIIVDPPRSGLSKKVIFEIERIAPKTILYVSCNRITLIRDLKLLEEFYEIETIRLFDMFPNTYHVECVCVLNRR